jgi:hypothetical protein
MQGENVMRGGETMRLKRCLIYLGVGMVLMIVISVLSMPPNVSRSKESTRLSSTTLNASVHFTGTQFVITNNDTMDWTNVKMEINGGVIRGGYALKHSIMKSGQTYTVGAMQFAKGDGTRFNPFTMKPNKFNIFSRDHRNITKGLWISG